MEYEFKPFDRVLVRDDESEEWVASFFQYVGESDSSFPFKMIWGCGTWKMCIPYEGNEHLVGTTDSPAPKEKSYTERQAECGIKVGDTVRIVRKAKNYENGWDDSWHPSMDEYVGEIGIVVTPPDYEDRGIRVEFENDWWNFPYFVLEKVEAKWSPKVGMCVWCGVTI